MVAFSHLVLQSLVDSAREVLENGASPELLRPQIEEIDKMVSFRDTQIGQNVLKKARAIYSDRTWDVEIDEATMIYHNGEDGFWVMGWHFVADEHFREDEAEIDDL